MKYTHIRPRNIGAHVGMKYKIPILASDTCLVFYMNSMVPCFFHIYIFSKLYVIFLSSGLTLQITQRDGITESSPLAGAGALHKDAHIITLGNIISTI